MQAGTSTELITALPGATATKDSSWAPGASVGESRSGPGASTRGAESESLPHGPIGWAGRATRMAWFTVTVTVVPEFPRPNSNSRVTVGVGVGRCEPGRGVEVDGVAVVPAEPVSRLWGIAQAARNKLLLVPSSSRNGVSRPLLATME